MAGVVGSVTACGGGGGGHPAASGWRPIGDSELVAAPAIPIVETAASGPGGGWLLGGVTVGSDGTRRVTIWVATGPSGTWRPASMVAVPGRDGPNETVFSIAGDSAHLVAFGYRRSPTEGYPRPSTWLSSAPGDWHEILEDREFLGGPNVIGFGGLTFGPHGFTLSGTWTDSRGRPTLAVWRSVDGSLWSRDSTEAAFDGDGAHIPLATGVADGATGILVTGTVEAPTRADPGHRQGGLWFSATGRSWTRVASNPGDRGSAGSSTFDAVADVPGGWLVAGTVTAAGRTTATVWFLDTTLQLGPPHLLPGPGSDGAQPVAVDTYAGRVFVVAARADRPFMWAGTTARGDPTGWTTFGIPVRHVGFPITTGAVTAGPAGLLLVVAGADRSAQWAAALHR